MTFWSNINQCNIYFHWIGIQMSIYDFFVLILYFWKLENDCCCVFLIFTTGNGSFENVTVHLARHIPSGQKIAIKCVDIENSPVEFNIFQVKMTFLIIYIYILYAVISWCSNFRNHFYIPKYSIHRKFILLFSIRNY